MKYIDNILKQNCLLSESVPPLKYIKRRTATKKDGSPAEEDEDVVDPYLLKIEQLNKFDIDEFHPRSPRDAKNRHTGAHIVEAPPAGQGFDASAR